MAQVWHKSKAYGKPASFISPSIYWLLWKTDTSAPQRQRGSHKVKKQNEILDNLRNFKTFSLLKLYTIYCISAATATYMMKINVHEESV